MKYSSAGKNMFFAFIAGVTVVALGVFVITLKNAVVAAPPVQEMPIPDTLPQATSTDTHISISPNVSNPQNPERLIIPKLGINAAVQHVGVSIHGTMAVPTNYSDAGWYRYGTIPGNIGNAVMAGHLDNGLKLPGVFKQLSESMIGDSIFIRTEAGEILKFSVRATSTLDYNTGATESVFGPSDHPQLKLITCEGTWVPEHKTYSNRLVVTALFIGTTTQIEP